MAAEPPAVVFDFESGDFQGWRIVEGEFYKPIVDREFYVNHPKQKYNKQGKYYLATVESPGGRTTGKPTGVIESPGFLPCEAHQEQLKRLAERRRADLAKRQIGPWQTALEATR